MADTSGGKHRPAVPTIDRWPRMQFVGIDWAYRRAAWCAKVKSGEIVAEGVTPADEDGLAKLVLALGTEVSACVEMMSGAVWVRDRLRAAGWQVEVADARKVKAIAPLACKTDKVDARVLADLCRRDLVPALWVPSFCDRELRERLNRRAHLIRLRTAAKNRVFGALSQWGLRIPLRVLRSGDPMSLLERRGLPEVWRRSVAEALTVVDMLDARIAGLEAELRPLSSCRSSCAVAGHDSGRRRAPRADDGGRDRRDRAVPGSSQADRVCWPGSPRGAVRSELAHRRALQSRLTLTAVGGDRSGAMRVAAHESLEPAVSGRQAAHRQVQPRQERRRAQGPDRRLARPRTRGAVQAQPPRARRRVLSRQAPTFIWPPDGPRPN